jgi:hypothetical protein
LSRVTFKTGKPHQEDAAVWARQRLADRGGRCFNVDGDQDGLLLADGVGMGKTWEAIAAAALILYKWDAPERDRRHILILCPANLVSKWEDELSTRSPLRERIDKWLKQLAGANHSASARRIHETLTRVMPIRRSVDVQTRKRRGKFKPPGGTYIISHNLIAGGGRGLAALRREEWDVVIVDEAHGAYARAALAKLESQQRLKTKILLTATPFQLDPRQWNGLAANIVKSGAKVMRVPSVAKYIEVLSDVFEKGSVADPPLRLVADASSVLRRIAARTVSRTSNRTFALMRLDGGCHDLPKRLDTLDDGGVRQLLADFKAANPVVRRETFERAYFQHRVDLALNRNQTYVAMRLRRVLSQGVGPPCQRRVRQSLLET